MAMLVRSANGEKAKRKVNACRDAGLQIFENFITGVTTVEHDGSLVLRCVRQGPNLWKLEYNDEFWEEIEADVPPPESPESSEAQSMTQRLNSPIKRG